MKAQNRQTLGGSGRAVAADRWSSAQPQESSPGELKSARRPPGQDDQSKPCYASRGRVSKTAPTRSSEATRKIPPSPGSVDLVTRYTATIVEQTTSSKRDRRKERRPTAEHLQPRRLYARVASEADLAATLTTSGGPARSGTVIAEGRRHRGRP